MLERFGASAKSSPVAPRTLFVLAHPDDEVLAVGARLERFAGSRLLTVTDGVPKDGEDARRHGFSTLEGYGEARRQELSAALAEARLPHDFARSLGLQVPDQTASLRLADLSVALAEEIEEFAPEVILTHPYEGGHPDHDACAFAVHAAARLARQKRPSAQGPVLLEAAFYHAGREGSMCTGVFLEDPRVPSPVVLTLTEEERARKRARLAYFGTQGETLAQFGMERETFRFAPSYDFTQPPHPGQLLYERFPWGMTGEQFRELASWAWSALFHRSMDGDPRQGQAGAG